MKSEFSADKLSCDGMTIVRCIHRDKTYPFHLLLCDFTVAFDIEGQGKVGGRQPLLLIRNSHGGTIFGETTMAIFKKTKQQSGSGRSPSERIPLTSALVAAIWNGEDKNGQVRFNWDVSELSEDKSRTYKTKRVESLLELPEFTVKLSEAFANSSAVPADVREKLAVQASALRECIELLGLGTEPKVNGQDVDNRVFANS